MLSNAIEGFPPIDLDQMRFRGFLEKRAREIKKCVDNVARGKGWNKIDRCPLCDHEDRRVIFSRFGIDIVQCDNCTVEYVVRFPVDTADVYSHEDYLLIATSDYLDNVDYCM